MARFNCKFCSFNAEQNSKPETCPYCGKPKSMVEEESAEVIIDSVEDMPEKL